PLGRFEVVRIGGLTVGRATYQPGGRGAEHVRPAVGARRCSVGHVGLVVSGGGTAAVARGPMVEPRAGGPFYIPPPPPRRPGGGGRPLRAPAVPGRRGVRQVIHGRRVNGRVFPMTLAYTKKGQS